VESLSQCEPGVAAELGAHYAVFQLPTGHPQGDLHHQQCGIAKSVAAQDHQNPRRIPPRRGSAEVAVSRSSAGGEEVNHADPSLARSAQPFHDSVGGTDAGPGENSAMNAHPTSTEMGRGRGTAPFPGAPSPKTNLAVYTKVWTHLWFPVPRFFMRKYIPAYPDAVLLLLLLEHPERRTPSRSLSLAECFRVHRSSV